MNSDLGAEPLQSEALAGLLDAIQTAQLIRRADEQSAGRDTEAYWFKHALVQDTAYASLMRHDRKRLHRLVAEALERAYPERPEELAPRLAEHFGEAGETARALHYFERAAENAAAHYANREALAFYSKALDAAEELQTDTRDSLYRARGVVYERIGMFDQARADLERAWQIAHEEGDALAEWQSLMDLGFAWTARDYTRAGVYFERALDLARTRDDPMLVAHTLNRVGNWYVNTDGSMRSLSYHYEALEMFESLGDKQGVAQTHDLLSMAYYVGADYQSGQEHADQALALFETLGDRWASVNTRVVSYLKRALLQGNTLPVTQRTPIGADERVQTLTELRQLGWRAGEAFALLVLGEGEAARGEYGRGLAMQQAAFQVARDINHHQWMAGAMVVYGAVYIEVLNFELAVPYLEQALMLARELGSVHWTRNSSGFLGSALVALNELDRAAEILEVTTLPHFPVQTLGQRQVWAARMELALARRDPSQALAALQTLLQGISHLTPAMVIPRLWILYARARMQMGDPASLATAEELLRAARTEARDTVQPGWEWRSAACLAQLYRKQERRAEATQEASAAQAIVARLADTIDDAGVRETFNARAKELIWDT
jgi:tetratricopeptide (TPR) repeat protein